LSIAPPPEIEVEDLAVRLAAGEPVAILDVRQPWETELCGLAGSLRIPLGELPGRTAELPTDQPLVVLCHHGVRSRQAAAWLRIQGYDRVINLSGGIDAWARRIDPTMKVY